MIVLNGKLVSEEIQLTLKNKVDKLIDLGIIPCLSVILVGDNFESVKYVNAKRKVCEKLKVKFHLIHFNKDVSEEEILKSINILNEDNNVHGILVQLPLPSHIDKFMIMNRVLPSKDVDGFHLINSGKLYLNREKEFVPCTPLGCIELLDYYNIQIKRAHTVIIGSSQVVGLPLSMMLLQRGATVTLCNINTVNIQEHTKRADILISCCGVPQLVKEEWVKEGVIIIDVGINLQDGKLVGDVDYERVKNKSKYITPVPGGVGPMTIAMLVKQVIRSAEASL
mgnify:FL=1|tara:strand:- start:1444 stop:2286 length:843 start_codon:yes stop_codon:yes gene_type:complete